MKKYKIFIVGELRYEVKTELDLIDLVTTSDWIQVNDNVIINVNYITSVELIK